MRAIVTFKYVVCSLFLLSLSIVLLLLKSPTSLWFHGSQTNALSMSAAGLHMEHMCAIRMKGGQAKVMWTLLLADGANPESVATATRTCQLGVGWSCFAEISVFLSRKTLRLFTTTPINTDTEHSVPCQYQWVSQLRISLVQILSETSQNHGYQFSHLYPWLDRA